MEFPPPDFAFTGLQFNPANFDNELLTTSASGTVPDPLVLNELDTNLIKARVTASGVSLYENALTYVNLGWSSLNELNLASYLMYFRSNAMYFQNFMDNCKFVIDTTLDNIGLIFYPNTSITGFQAGSIRVTNVSAPSADDLGTIQITGATLSTPLTLVSNAIASTLNLFTTQTGIINLGGTGTNKVVIPNTILASTPSSVMNLFTDQTNSISLGNSGITLRSPNTVVSQLAASPQNLFTTTSGAINLGGSSTLRLVTPNDINSVTIANDQNLFTTTTGNIFLGNSTAVSTSQLNLNAQNNGIINIGNAVSRTADIRILNGTNCTGNLLIGGGTSYGGNIQIATNTNALNTMTIGTNVFSSMIIRGLNYSNQSQNINLNTGSGTGVVNISNGTSSGNVNIGNSATANININTAIVNTLGVVNTNISGTQNTNIGTGSNSGTISIGNNSSATTMLGYTTINNTGADNTDINAGGGTGSVYIGTTSSPLISLIGATMDLTSSGGVNVTGGIKMAGTNVSGTPWKIMYGRITSTPAVGAGAYSAAINQNFGATFGGNPIVLLVVQKNTWTAVAAYFHAGVDAVSTTAFSWSVRNTAGGTTAAANSYYINWFAIGQY